MAFVTVGFICTQPACLSSCPVRTLGRERLFSEGFEPSWILLVQVAPGGKPMCDS